MPEESGSEHGTESRVNIKKIVLIVAAIAIVAGGLGVWYVEYLVPHNQAVEKFSAAADGLEQRNTELDEAISSLQDLMGSEDAPLDPTTLDAASDAIGAAQGAKQEAPEMPAGTEEILLAAEEVDQMGDYSEQLAAIETAATNLQDSIDQLLQVTNPSEQFVIERLTGLSNITGVEAVTEGNDPNGNLNKDGGYTATVFFSSDLVDASETYAMEGYTGIPAIGTEGGGAVEVYATAEDAEKRNEYLASFDGGIFASGSHAVVGTCVIRTSDHLTASQQDALEQEIIESLTRLS